MTLAKPLGPLIPQFISLQSELCDLCLPRGTQVRHKVLFTNSECCTQRRKGEAREASFEGQAKPQGSQWTWDRGQVAAVFGLILRVIWVR